MPLERAALRAKRLFPEALIADTLAALPQPPALGAVRSATATLVSLGALDPAVDRAAGQAATSEALTPLGCHLAALPLDVRIGKLCLLGAMLGAADPATTIAAALTCKSPFAAPFGSPGVRAEVDLAKLQLAVGGSDHLTLLNAYESWRAIRSTKERAAFCQQHFLSSRTLDAIGATKDELHAALREIGMARGGGGRQAAAAHEDAELLKALLVGAMWPRCAKVELPSGGKPARRGADADAPPPPVKLKIKDDTGVGSASLHPSCVLARQAAALKASYCVYGEAHKSGSGAVMLREATPVPPLSLLLFGGRLRHDAKAGMVGIDDGWVRFRLAPEAAELILAVRRMLDDLLSRKWEAPRSDTAAQERMLLEGVRELLAMGR